MSEKSSPVLVTTDASLAADVERLAAAAGTPVEVTGDVSAARGRWSSTPLVLVGADLVTALADSAPARRCDVHVVARRHLPDHLFRDALRVGAESVVELPEAEVWLTEALADSADGSASRGVVVGVLGGCGGAGATTFAAALATVAECESAPVTLVDADPCGAGAERVVGLEDVGAGWGSLLESSGRLGSRAFRAALPERAGLAVLGWGSGRRTRLRAAVVREAISAASRGGGLVVVDLPRYLDEGTAEAVSRCDRLVLVCPLDVAAVAAAARVAADVVPLLETAWLVTRGRGSALDPDEVAGVLGLPLAATMADQRRLAESVELGLGPLATRNGPLARAARRTLSLLVGGDAQGRRR